jgi:prepilin-type N-terminal cleavage/methylation domain-containing protein
MRTDYRTDKNDRAFTKRQERGFSLVELLVVCVVVVIISAIAIPNIMQMNTNYKLDAAGHTLASMLQQARMQAVKNNQPAYAKFDTSSGMAYVTNDPSNAFASGNPDVSLASGLSFQTSTPTSFHDQLDAYVGATSGSPAQVATNIGFNARGLPCIANSTNPAVCTSSTSGFEWFVQNGRGGWEAVTVTPAGRIKSWRLSKASGGTATCGYAACWL